MNPVKRDPLDLLAAGATAALSNPDEEAIDGLVEIATLAAAGRRRGRRKKAQITTALAAAACILVGVTAAWSLSAPGPTAAPVATATPEAATPPATASTLSLPHGDVLHPLGAADLTVANTEGPDTSFVLTRGAALFDIAPRPEGASVTVRTPHGSVMVLGTVFTVRVTEDDSYVEVFEGRVRVRRGGQTAELVAEERAVMSSLGDAPPWASPLTALGREAAVQRAMARPPSAPGEPAFEQPAAGPEPGTSQIPSVEVARSWLRGGERDRAMRAAERARTERPRDGAYRMLFADALRSGGQHEAAADAYDEAARLLSPSRATHAGLLSASLRLEHLDDPTGALAGLTRTRAADPGSPVEERGLTLRVRCLLALDRSREARAAATNYTMRFPAGSAIDWMRELSEAP
ncbi:MAG: FecR domain-containing protein [Deltaproteobacteria bacterium]|nr:FecR domain-containing protein [Deltaproteobacteria bacterium]